MRVCAGLRVALRFGCFFRAGVPRLSQLSETSRAGNLYRAAGKMRRSEFGAV